MKAWDKRAKLCGNCVHWMLSEYHPHDRDPPGRPPYGNGGNHADGTAADCRFNAPVRLAGDSRACWPQVKRIDHCGQFRRRPNEPEKAESIKGDSPVEHHGRRPRLPRSRQDGRRLGPLRLGSSEHLPMQELVNLLDDPSSVEICHTKDGQHSRRYLTEDEAEFLYQAVLAEDGRDKLKKGIEAAYAALFKPDEADAIDNLEGALIDIRRLKEQGKPTDDVCINTLNRIMQQLLKAHAELEAATCLDLAKET